MLMQTAAEAVQSGGISSSNNFTIAVTGKAFDVLSRQLYKRPVAAVVREVSCNAADAHTMVGKPQHTFEISVPSMLSPTFAVKDFGPGLSEDDVLHLYSTYFASTKDRSNDMIGGFGLGCKSPFAVSDQFTVVSRFNGEATTYICIRIDGTPTVNKAGSVPCGDDTGITVTVPIKPADLREWRNSIGEFFSDWPEKPIRTGTGKPLNLDDLESAMRATEADMESANTVAGYPEWQHFITGRRGLSVRMGLVKYAISVPLDGAAGRLQNTDGETILTLPMGAINVAPSREEVDYTDKTKAAVQAAAQRMIAEVSGVVAEKIKACTSLYEARKFVYGAEADNSIKGSKSLRNFIKAGFLSIKAPTWNGKPVVKDAHFTIAPKPGQTQDAYRGFGYEIVPYRKRTYTNTGRMHPAFAGSLTGFKGWTFNDYDLTGYSVGSYVWSDKAPSSNTVAKLKHNADKFAKRSHYNPNVTLIKSDDFDGLAKLFDEHGFAPLLKLSDLDDPPKNASQVTRSTTKTKGYVFTNSGWDNTEKEIDLTTPGYWAEMFNGGPIARPALNWNLDKARAVGLVDSSKPIVGFAQRKIGPKLLKALASKGWIKLDPTTFSTTSDDSLERAARNIVLGNAAMQQKLHSKSPGVERAIVWGGLKHIDITKVPSELAAVFEFERKLKPKVQWSESDPNKIVESLGFVVPPGFDAHAKAATQDFNKLVGDYHNFLDAHPMLRYINESIPAAEFLNYISRKI